MGKKSQHSRRVMTSIDHSSPERQFYFIDKNYKVNNSKRCSDQPNLKETNLSSIDKGHSYSLRFDKEEEKSISKRGHGKSE